MSSNNESKTFSTKKLSLEEKTNIVKWYIEFSNSDKRKCIKKTQDKFENNYEKTSPAKSSILKLLKTSINTVL